MTAHMTALLPAFADPVLESQAVFRAVLDAMARPGRLHTVAAPATPPPPLDRATAAVLLTLVDAETPLFLGADAAGEWVAFHCGAPCVEPALAHFAVCLETPPFAALSAGSDEEPERSATLILQVAALGEGDRFLLRGPGLAETATLAVRGLAPGFGAFWAANRRLFPRGIDVILCAGDRLAALPRTVAMEPA